MRATWTRHCSVTRHLETCLRVYYIYCSSPARARISSPKAGIHGLEYGIKGSRSAARNKYYWDKCIQILLQVSVSEVRLEGRSRRGCCRTKRRRYSHPNLNGPTHRNRTLKPRIEAVRAPTPARCIATRRAPLIASVGAGVREWECGGGSA